MEEAAYKAIDYITKLYNDLSVVVIFSLIFFLAFNLLRKNFNPEDTKIDKVNYNSVTFAIFVGVLKGFAIVVRNYFGY